MNINDYLQLMSDRYSVRKFSDEPVAQEQIDAAMLVSAMVASTLPKSPDSKPRPLAETFVSKAAMITTGAP